ncbi:MAG: ABC transporter permease [Candidatus Dormibacteraceae bacterium]
MSERDENAKAGGDFGLNSAAEAEAQLPNRSPEPKSHAGVRFGWTAMSRTSGLLLPLVAFWAVLSLTTPVFLTAINITNLLLEASVVGILAVGTTAVLITEEIDLSIGAVEGIGAVVTGIVIVSYHVAWPIGVGAAIAAGVVVGWINGWFTTKLGVPSFIVTLSTLGICTGIALQVTDGQSIYGYPPEFQQIGIGVFAGLAYPVFIAAALVLLLHVILTKTKLGLEFYSVGGNRRAAKLVGIDVDRVKTVAFIIGGAASALAGVVQAARLNSANGTFGSGDLLDAIAAVVIGGTSLTGGVGSVIGTALGVLLVATIHNGLNLWNVSPFLQQVVVGLIILVMGVATTRRNG